ncbi:DUF1156 domain-containing protein, partial [Phormidium sp. FACHB-1136]|uniref:DUF1156 domain-containing protein n=1 Tax=Phormidium sp. FACHB-1136 TaxID=2692848 RepID=UPI00168727F8
MTEPTPKPTRPAVFIEKIFPVTLLNKQVYYEHGGNPFKGLHRWYSRKPLSFSRASVLGSLLPDSVTMEEFEYLLGLNRRVDGHSDSTTKLYKTPPSPERIKQVHDLCEQTWGTRTPTVLDAFAGGGSIPFEAVRYGLNVLASDLNPVAVVTMKAAMEYPLKFGPDLQHEIDKWVKWVGDEAEKRLAEFFPSQEGETVQNYLWAHTVVCPHCESEVPLSPNWWIDKSPGSQKKGRWSAAKPVPNMEHKKVDFLVITGKKGNGSSIRLSNEEEYFPDDTVTIKRGEGRCLNCEQVIESQYIDEKLLKNEFNHLLYAVIFKRSDGGIGVRLPVETDLDSISKSEFELEKIRSASPESIPSEPLLQGQDTRCFNRGVRRWEQLFNSRQLLTLLTFVEIIKEAKSDIQAQYDLEMAEAIIAYLGIVISRCIDKNSRLTHWNQGKGLPGPENASAQHSLNLMWNYPEVIGSSRLWRWCANPTASNYSELCDFLGVKSSTSQLLDFKKNFSSSIRISSESADSLFGIEDKSVDSIVIDPPYYSTIQYSEISDFFYVWMKRTLGDIMPELFNSELTDKDREAVANPSRFRNMGESAEELANRDYEAKMALAFAEYFRVLRDDGVMTVQFNHKDSGAWDVLAKSLIDAGFEITASWAVSTENP